MREIFYTKRADISAGVLVAVVSDLHNKPIGKIMKSLEKNKPDVILIPGDLSDGHYDSPDSHLYPTNAIECLKKCSSLAPTYYSIGNHENTLSDESIELIKSTGARLLDDSYEHLGDLVIGGLSSKSRRGSMKEKGKPDTSWLGDFSSEQGFHILLSHHPEHYEKYISGFNIELTLSGHAHGGQWKFFKRGVFAPGQGLFPKLTRGYYFSERLLVSAGLANTGGFIPRFFNPTELVYVRLTPEG